MIPTPKTSRAAHRGARVTATTPDPARGVAAARETLGADADRYRIAVSRPAVPGHLARCTVTRTGPLGVTFGTTATAKVTR